MNCVKERPIIFSGEMVRAILDGRKTQTRRIIIQQPSFSEIKNDPMPWYQRRCDRCWQNFTYENFIKRCPYGQPGDRLWVRETFALLNDQKSIVYKADGDPKLGSQTFFTRWSPLIHMPRCASRITLEIVNVRVERVQDISGADALAEGFYLDGAKPYCLAKVNAKEWYKDLWNSIHGPGAWERNDWVWVIEFNLIN